MMKRWSIYGLILLCIIICGCAAQGRLTGGEKDEKPPSLQKDLSTPNFQTNYFPTKIELTFDEFIEVKNAIKEIGVSPPLQNFPKVTSRGKQLFIEFQEDEVLRENATYTINFGSAIRDYHESNILENFSFIFSTGDEIDSLSVSGKVVNALDGKAIENAVVMLYDNLSDTAVYNEKPFYFIKTDKSGKFRLNNIKEDTFAIYAIVDENVSYTWDRDIESIAFIDSTFFLTDSFTSSFPLAMSLPKSTPFVLSVESFQEGKIKVAFSSEIDSIPPYSFSQPIEHKKHFIKDSLFISYDTTSNPIFKMFLLQDTFKIKPKKKKRKKPYRIKNLGRENILKITPSDTLKLVFDFPIIEHIKDSIMVSDTSNQLVSFSSKVSDDGRALYIEPKRKYDIPHTVIIQDSTLFSYNGVYNDSLSLKFSYLSKEKLGTVHLKLDSVVSQNNLLIVLMDGDKELNRYNMSNANDEISINNLIPQKYILKIIEDVNGNGKWDPGNFIVKSQPEKIVFKELEKLKENWELEVELSHSLFNSSTSTTSNDLKGK